MLNGKRKGNAGEHAFSRFLMSHGFSAHRNTMSGGSIWKGDIANSLDLTIEIKTVKRINLLEAWQQVDRDASKARNEPLLAIRFDHMPQGEWLIVQHSSDWIEGIKERKNSKKAVPTPSNTVVLALQLREIADELDMK